MPCLYRNLKWQAYGYIPSLTLFSNTWRKPCHGQEGMLHEKLSSLLSASNEDDWYRMPSLQSWLELNTQDNSSQTQSSHSTKSLLPLYLYWYYIYTAASAMILCVYLAILCTPHGAAQRVIPKTTRAASSWRAVESSLRPITPQMELDYAKGPAWQHLQFLPHCNKTKLR